MITDASNYCFLVYFVMGGERNRQCWSLESVGYGVKCGRATRGLYSKLLNTAQYLLTLN